MALCYFTATLFETFTTRVSSFKLQIVPLPPTKKKVEKWNDRPGELDEDPARPQPQPERPVPCPRHRPRLHRPAGPLRAATPRRRGPTLRFMSITRS